MSEVRGQWFDGRDSRARPVVLSQSASGDIRVASDDGESEFPATAFTISPRLGRTPRILRLSGQGQIECPDDELLERWFAAPSRLEAAADWLERRRSAALVSAAATVLTVVLFFQFGLPWLAQGLAEQMPAAVERSMASQVLALLDHLELQPSQLPEARQAKLHAQFDNLKASVSRRQDLRLLFRHAPSLGANGFALPDGRIVLTDELVALAKHDDELLAVLAHEIGHHQHRHALRQTLESSGIIVIASLLFGDSSGSSLSISMPTVLLELGFSRDHEREADDFGLALLKQQGKSPQAFADILRRMSQLHGEPDLAGIGYFSTHPPSPERIARAELAAQTKP